MTRKRKALFWFFGVLAAIGTILGLIVGDAHRRATELAREHDLDVKARIAAIRARVHPPRAALFGAPIPGNGAADLFAALRSIHQIPDSETDVVPVIAGDYSNEDVIDDDLIELFYAAYRPQLESLRLALRHERIVANRRYEQGFQMDFSDAGDAIRAARFLSGLSDHLYQWGRDEEALESVLLSLAMAQAEGRDGPLVSALVQVVCEGIAEEAWRAVLEGYDLGAGVLASAARAMDELRSTRPSMADSFEVEDAIGRRGLVDLVLAQDSGKPIEYHGFWEDRHWRFLFSRRLVQAGTLPVLERYYAGMIGLRSRPPQEWGPAAALIQEQGLRSRNPLVVKHLPALTRAYGREAIALMNWTLMRVATAIAWYEADKGVQPPTLQDLVPRYLPSLPVCPLTGKPLGTAPGKVWSFGVDGVDDGGTPNPRGDEQPGGDVVWLVKRTRK